MVSFTNWQRITFIKKFVISRSLSNESGVFKKVLKTLKNIFKQWFIETIIIYKTSTETRIKYYTSIMREYFATRKLYKRFERLKTVKSYTCLISYRTSGCIQLCGQLLGFIACIILYDRSAELANSNFRNIFFFRY